MICAIQKLNAIESAIAIALQTKYPNLNMFYWGWDEDEYVFLLRGYDQLVDFRISKTSYNESLESDKSLKALIDGILNGK